jgi:hypothetical protein
MDDHLAGFPRHGARARIWSRFERDLRAWLETPQGRFATWRAERRLARPAPGGAHEADRTM